MAKLIDRFRDADGTLVIRAQHERTGETFDVYVDEKNEENAGRHWGGSDVPYTLERGKAHYVGDGMTVAEVDGLIWKDRLWHARKLAPTASESTIRGIFDAPMSRNQRIAALKAAG